MTESITTNLVRKHFEVFDSDAIVEEQQSVKPAISKLLKHASKSGDGKGYPDFIVSFPKEPDLILVIECKANVRNHVSNNQIDYSQSFSRQPQNPKDYAVDGAIHYASFLSRQFDVIAIGFSGNSTKNRINHYFRFKGSRGCKQISSQNLLSPADYIRIYYNDEEKVRQDYESLLEFIKELNKRLHLDKVTENNRSLLISSILIALENRAFKISYKNEKDEDLPERLLDTVMIQLRDAGIWQERLTVLNNKFSFILTESALISKANELKEIISAVDDEVNSFVKTHKYYDVLSELYVEFLRYANAEKGLGIVLTPPHITGFFAELAEVNHKSVVYDNCTGTGGFLIASLRKMIKSANGDSSIESEIKNSQLYGVELQSSIYPLAVSNMYINQDGKSNIYQCNCFDDQIIKTVKAKKPTVGLLNPPYKADKKRDIEELQFVLNNLDCLQQSGVCIAILPMQSALANRGKIRDLKEKLLESHTLEAVFSMPDELFFNSKVGVVTCIMIFTAHRPHPKDKQTYFGYYKDDGFTKRKSNGRADYDGKWESIQKTWIDNFRNQNEKPGLSIKANIDSKSEWAAESYMETDYSVLCNAMFEKTLLDYSTYLFSNQLCDEVSNKPILRGVSKTVDVTNWFSFYIEDLFEIKGSKTTSLLELEERGKGKFPYITTKATNNGVDGFYNYHTENSEDKCVLTIDSAVIGYCSFHDSAFSASDHVEVLYPKFPMDVYIGMFMVTIFNLEQYRYNYGRKCSQARLKKARIKLPCITPPPQFQADV